MYFLWPFTSFYSKYYADGGNEEIDTLFDEMDYFKNGWDFGAENGQNVYTVGKTWPWVK